MFDEVAFELIVDLSVSSIILLHWNFLFYLLSVIDIAILFFDNLTGQISIRL